MIPSPTPADFEGFREELAELRALLAGLSLRVAELETRLPAPQPTAAAPSGAAASGSNVLASASSLGSERVSAAQSVGNWLRRCLDGQHRGLSGRELIQQPSRFYLVVRDISGVVHNPPLVFTSWKDTKGSVNQAGSAGDSIFVGLPTKEEGRIAVLQAGLLVPSALQKA